MEVAARVDDDEGEVALELPVGLLDRVDEVAGVRRLDQVGQHLGVGVALEDVTAYAEGVNQYIDEARTDPTKLPAEYQALQIVPEDWLVTDTAAVARARAEYAAIDVFVRLLRK